MSIEGTVKELLKKYDVSLNSSEGKRLRDLERGYRKGEISVSDIAHHIKNKERYGWKYFEKSDYRELEKRIK